jgi:SAM-dependent methyltransferase
MQLCLKCNTQFRSADWKCSACDFLPEAVTNFFTFAPDLMQYNTGFDAQNFAKLIEVEAANFWFRSRNQLIIWALKKYFSDAENFLEIGCGTGYVLSGIQKNFPNLKLFGSEISARGLNFAAQRVKHAMLFQMDARKIPFVEEYDVIGAFDVFEHIEEDELVLQQIHQALKPGGGIILTVPQHQFLWSQQDEHACHVRRYNIADLKNKMIKAGFKIIKTTSFVSLLLPLMLVSRLQKRKKIENYDPLQELKLSKTLNIIFENILAFERLVIQLGINFPVGGSLLMIANKL